MFDVFYFSDGQKPNLFAHERAVDSFQHAQKLSRTRYFWIVNYLCDYQGWDWLYEPVPWQAHQRHAWASQHQQDSGTYLVPKAGYTDTNYHTDRSITRLPTQGWPWTVPDYIDTDSFDFSWHPNPDEYYEHHFPTQHWERGGPVYYRGADELKFETVQQARIKSNPDAFKTLFPVHYFDYSWRPHPEDPPFVYVWGNQWHAAEQMPTVEYHVPGATERKYMDEPVQLLANQENWSTLAELDHFDYSWVPDPFDPPYIYVFGNQHYPGAIMPTVEYHVAGATERKYVDFPVAQLAESMTNWEVLDEINYQKWDWSWVPNPLDPPYIYQFGNQWNPAELRASIRYHVPGATEIKYMDRLATRRAKPGLFEELIPVDKFDYSWEPNPFDPPYIYVFGNQWNPAELEATVTFTVPGATERKYMDHLIATVAPNPSAWTVLDDVKSFDYSWRPNPTAPPYIYVFGNQWMPAEVRPAVEYRVPGAVERHYMDEPRAQRYGDASRFETLHDCDFDWSWEPEPGSPPYIYVFGNQWHSAEIMPTVTFAVDGATERKYMDGPVATLPSTTQHWTSFCDHRYTFDYSWKPDPGEPPMVYVFGNQHWSAEKMPTVIWSHPNITEQSPTKYMDYPHAQLLPNETLWTVPADIDLADVDFTWVPDPGEPPYIYQFATQHQKTGGAQYRVPGATEVKYLERVQIKTATAAAPIFEINHLDGNAGQIPNTVKTIRYFDNYRDTLIRLAKSLVGEYEHVWVCSSICDYEGFDFTWHPEVWQSTMLHVFASNEQKFGDTFYMHVPTFAARAEKKQLLEWYSVNYVPRKMVPRRGMPVIEHTQDTHVDAVKTTEWNGPLALFTTNGLPITIPAVPLWREETKTIVPLSAGASAVIVPKTAVPTIKTQLYDYPYIDKTQRKRHGDERLDIVFISNGENEAEHLFAHLCNCVAINKIHRVQNVKGRVAAYHAAARASTTPWFFAVFGKLHVDPDFDWAWQPDRMQQPKHYIFHAENPINGLIYGHQAMIAYNKQLVLENPGVGLDFTLDQAHEVVPIVSGSALYYTDNWMCWRTAFREALKLKASLPDVENEYRLDQWLTVDKGAGQWSSKGAQDAVEFYDAVNGNPTELRKSYEWDWLASYAFVKRSLTPT